MNRYFVERKIDNYFKKKILLVDFKTIFFHVLKVLSWKEEQTVIVKFIERPYSIILKIRNQYNASEAFYIKIYKNRNYQHQRESLYREYKITNFWFQKFKQEENFSVVEPVWINLEFLIIVTKESKGKNLLSWVKSAGVCPVNHLRKKVDTIFYMTGEWLQKFQSIPTTEKVPFVEKPVNFGLSYIQEYMNIRMEKMKKNILLDFDQDLQNRINHHIEMLWKLTNSQKNKLCYVHTDFTLSNVLATEHTITVLDFQKSEINSPYKDLARFYHQLFLLKFKPIFSNRIVQQVQKQFLAGYGNISIDQDPLFKIFFMLHQINHLGKISRYWEHSYLENLYSRRIVKNVLKDLRKMVYEY